MNDTSLSLEHATDASRADLERHFELDAGLACFDFVNTLRGRRHPPARDYLPSYPALLAFSRVTGAIDAPTAARIAELAVTLPEEAARAHSDALDLREGLYRIFAAIAAGASPAEADLDILNAALIEEAAASRLAASHGALHREYRQDAHLRRPIWPLARQAADVLLGEDRARIRECAADDCGWIFLDTSRNRSRRWCSMTSCGNRAKVQQFRQRQRAAHS